MKQVLISKRQVAELLGGISESQVLRYVRMKKLPCIRITRHTMLFNADAVKQWAKIRPALKKTENNRQRQTGGKLRQRSVNGNGNKQKKTASYGSITQRMRQEHYRNRKQQERKVVCKGGISALTKNNNNRGELV